MTIPAFLSTAVESWAGFYGHHQWVSVTVRYLHLASLLVGGGAALAADRQILRAARGGPPERSGVVKTLDATHRVVVPALALVVITGILMTASDAETFLGSRIYWSKMGLVALLLLNGVGLLAAERAVSAEKPKAWTWMGLVSSASLVLWLTILFAGVWLTAAA
jgi:hypothetical protein